MPLKVFVGVNAKSSTMYRGVCARVYTRVDARYYRMNEIVVQKFV